MTTLPAAGYFSDPDRTNAEAKTAQDDMLAFVRQMLGGQAPSELTIAAGAAVPSRGMHTIDTEADAASDDLANLDTTNLPDGSWLLIGCADAARIVTVKHNAGGAGQVALTGAADAVLDATSKYILLRRSGANWAEIGRFGFEIVIAAGAVTDAKESADDYADIASATTTDLSTTTARNVRITGTTTITGLGTFAAGRVRALKFAGALTLTHHATSLVLPTGANIVTAAGDTCEAISRGSGNWEIRNYSRASGAALVAGGVIVDRAYAAYTTSTALTPYIPLDDTIPQSSEGTQILSASITPKTTTNRIRARVSLMASVGSTDGQVVAALFAGGAGAVQVGTTRGTTGGPFTIGTIVLEYEYVPGTTSAQTLTVRVGHGISGNAAYVNGDSAGRKFGGAAAAVLVLEEITA